MTDTAAEYNPVPEGTATKGGNEPLTGADLDAMTAFEIAAAARAGLFTRTSKHAKGRTAKLSKKDKARNKRRAGRELQARKTQHLDMQAMLNAKLEAHRGE